MKRVQKIEANGIIFNSCKEALNYIEELQVKLLRDISEKIAHKNVFRITEQIMASQSIKDNMKQFLKLEDEKIIEDEFDNRF